VIRRPTFDAELEGRLTVDLVPFFDVLFPDVRRPGLPMRLPDPMPDPWTFFGPDRRAFRRFACEGSPGDLLDLQTSVHVMPIIIGPK
jgi:hypothetical protein